MSKTKKSLIGAATLLTTIFFISFFFLSKYESSCTEKDIFYALSIILGILMMLYIFIMVGFYCYFVIDSAHIPKERKAVWIIIILLFHVVAMPILWFVHIWNEPKE